MHTIISFYRKFFVASHVSLLFENSTKLSHCLKEILAHIKETILLIALQNTWKNEHFLSSGCIELLSCAMLDYPSCYYCPPQSHLPTYAYCTVEPPAYLCI